MRRSRQSPAPALDLGAHAVRRTGGLDAIDVHWPINSGDVVLAMVLDLEEIRMRQQLRIGLRILPQPAMGDEDCRGIRWLISACRIRGSVSTHAGIQRQGHGRYVMFAGKSQLRLDQPLLGVAVGKRR